MGEEGTVRSVKNFVICLLATATLVATTTVAAAESVGDRDPRGDAPRGIDVTHLRLGNADHAVRLGLRFADLHRARVRSVRVELDVGKPLGWGYVVTFRRPEPGAFEQKLSWVRLYAEGGTKLPACDGLRLTWGDDRADVRLPRSCMSKPGDQRVRANVRVTSFGGGHDRVPNGFLTFTRWAKRG